MSNEIQTFSFFPKKIQKFLIPIEFIQICIALMIN
jgi:hypothetical protein